MGRRRKTGDRPYRFWERKDRPIAVQFDHIPGKWISTGCYDMPGAITFAEDRLDHDGVDKSSIPSLRDFARDFFSRRDKDSLWERDRVFGHSFEESRYTKYQAFLDNYILPAFGAYLVTAITSRMIEDWLPYITGRGGVRLSSDTKNKTLVAFRLVMGDVKRLGYRNDNPAADARPMAPSGKRREALSPQALLILFPSDPEERVRVWHGLMWATYFSIMYDTGFRPGEVAALRVCDVWQTAKGLAVATERTVNRNAGKLVDRVKTTGKGYSQRVGLLYDDTAQLVLRLIEQNDLSDEDMLFRAHHRRDGLLMPETANKHMKAVLQENGLYRKGLVQYCLRHTYTTERRGDMPDELLAVSMGHTHLRSDYDHQKAADLIRRLDARRDDFFANHGRLEKDSDIRPIVKTKKAP